MNFLFLFGVLAAVTSTAFASNVVCYYASWAVYKPDPFKIENIDPTLCTHVVYSFIGLDQNGQVKSLDPWNDIGDEWHEGGFKKFSKLRNLNPSVKLIVSVGGWNEGPTRFQSMVRDPQKRHIFLLSTLSFINQYKFDGLEIAWMFQDSFGGTPEDREGLSQLVKEMKPQYEKNNLILSAATSANLKVFENSYDMPTLSKYLDFINIISYDLHGFWDGKTGHLAPLYPMKSENEAERLVNLEAIVKKYIEKGAIPEKLNLGTVGYGRTFTLWDPNNHGMNSPSKGAGKIEPLPFGTFCMQDKLGQWNKFRNEEQVVPYAVSGDQWVGYEDCRSLTAKAKFAKGRKLGGVTFFSLDTDDFKGSCSSAKFPLLRALKTEMTK